MANYIFGHSSTFYVHRRHSRRIRQFSEKCRDSPKLNSIWGLIRGCINLLGAVCKNLPINSWMSTWAVTKIGSYVYRFMQKISRSCLLIRKIFPNQVSDVYQVPGPRTCTGVYWIYRYHDVTNDETIRFVRRIRQTVRGIYYLLEVVVRQGSASRWRFENLWRPQLRCFIKWPERHVDISRCWCFPCSRFRRASTTSCLGFLFVY